VNKRIAALGIDFADSEFKNFELINNKLIVYLESWDAKTLKINFLNPIQFSYKLGYHILNIYEVLGNSQFLEEAIIRKYREKVFNHPYKLFQIDDMNDSPFIQVAAESVQCEKIR
jgi:hypothetical protein